MPRIYKRIPVAERFWVKVRKTERCWEWLGSKRAVGYGSFNINGQPHYAHRVAYELAFGSIPKGLTIDHLCRNKSCVRPDHLEAVTLHENLLRGEGFPGRRARQTHCLRGHPFNQKNTYFPPKSRSRMCRVCKQIRKHQVLSVSADQLVVLAGPVS